MSSDRKHHQFNWKENGSRRGEGLKQGRKISRIRGGAKAVELAVSSVSRGGKRKIMQF